ncbi:MAG TPA: LysM domain-containing protein [Aggregatilineaceae bacterium]|nr:LysM domain-containing protein [Aggregatilineaceae bacterium]
MMNKAILGLIIVLLLVPGLSAGAQGGNLLQNAGFDDALTGRATINGAVPVGWNVWGTFGESDQETLAVLYRSAPRSWRLRTEHGQPMGGGYQTVSAQVGSTYRFSIYALIWTCDDEQWQCRDDTHTFADTSSGGRVRIGIDPTGGTDPYSTNIQWSSFSSPFTWGALALLSVDAKATGSQITVFTYYTADKTMRWHDVFWDDASLTVISSGGSNNPTAAAPAATAAPVIANAQTKPDGSQVHIVQPGQTLWGIAQVYGVTLDQLRLWNNIIGSTIYEGQAIIVKPAPAASAPTAAPTSASAASTSIPSPTPFTQMIVTPAVTVSPQPEAVAADTPDEDSDDSTRTVVTVVALVVILGAVGATGGLVGFLGYTFFRRRGA